MAPGDEYVGFVLQQPAQHSGRLAGVTNGVQVARHGAAHVESGVGDDAAGVAAPQSLHV